MNEVSWIERDFAAYLAETAATRPAVVLTGGRQTGKTSLLTQAFPAARYTTLDLPGDAKFAEEDGAAFLRENPRPLIIDEAQYAPSLFRHIKADIDKHRNKHGQYLITGSQKFVMANRAAESLSGRVAILELFTLSLAEYSRYAKVTSREDIIDFIFLGGYPELHVKRLNPVQFYSDLTATYLERDIRHIVNVKSLYDFDRFIRLLALRGGQQLVLSSVAADIGITVNTAKSWLSALETAGIIWLIEPYFENLGLRLVKSPKVYFCDTGLMCFLAGFRSAREIVQHPMWGAIFETFALGQIRRYYSNQGMSTPVYYLRDHSGREVDFVIPRAGNLILVECKSNPDTDIARLAGFTFMEKIAPKRIAAKVVISLSLRSVRRKDVHFQNLAKLSGL